MNPESWGRVQELHAEVCALPAEEREAFLERAAARDPEAVAQVRRLLELQPPSQFIEPVTESERADRYFGGGLEGTRLGDFLLEREIGRGGMGVVYGAVQLGLERRVAVKVLPLAAHGRDRTLERFRREAKAATQLQHPRIVDVLAYGEGERTAWFAMRWVDGHDLGVEIERQVDPDERAGCLLPSEDAASYLRAVAERVAELADAVQHAHERGVVHRDIKPQNILLDRQGRMNLADFGLARSEAFGALSRTAEVRGTPYYMSPEQVRAAEGPVDHRTDVYSLGVVLYELLARRRPFQAATPVLVMHAITHEEPRRPTAIDAQVPRELETICLHAMEKRAEDRYQSAAALAEDLRRYVRGEPLHARPPTVAARVRRWLARHARKTSALVAGFVATGGTLGAVLWIQDRADDVRLRVDLEGGLDATGANAYVVELDPAFRTRRRVRELGRWPVEWVRLEPGVYRFVIEIEERAALEVEFLALVPGEEQRRTARLLDFDQSRRGMLAVPAGTLELQYASYSGQGGDREQVELVHELAAFHLDELPVTNRDYAQFLSESGTPAPPYWDTEHDDAWPERPVTGLTYDEAQTYANHVGKRLPTWPELQLASRGPEGRRLPWGDDDEGLLRALQLGRPELDQHEGTHEGHKRWYLEHVRAVGMEPARAAGPYGHRDLLGNVTVWTSTPATHLRDGRPESDPTYLVLGGQPAFRSIASAALGMPDQRMGLSRYDRAVYVGLRLAASDEPRATEPDVVLPESVFGQNR